MAVVGVVGGALEEEVSPDDIIIIYLIKYYYYCSISHFTTTPPPCLIFIAHGPLGVTNMKSERGSLLALMTTVSLGLSTTSCSHHYR